MQNLYRHFDENGNLLYVGVSLSALRRLCDHRASHWFEDIVRVEVEKLPDREAALEAERKAIYEENPIHNLRRPTPKEVLKRQAEEAEKSRRELVSRLVQFNPMYTVQQAAADALESLIPLLPEGEAPGHIGNWRAKTQRFVDGLREAAEAGEPLRFY